jgi:non-canonical purine NTP pyrophosphatase (RdgB/HAM1 family)
MIDFIYVSGNPNKVKYLELWLGTKVKHHAYDLIEIQSLDLKSVLDHKIRQAYEIVKKPVLVDDSALTFQALGRLPGTLIRWFLEELGTDGLCSLLKAKVDRSATALVLYGLYDGKTTYYFEGTVEGTIALEPKGTNGFGYHPIFIPDGRTKTYAEMTDKQMQNCNSRAIAIEKLKQHLLKNNY